MAKEFLEGNEAIARAAIEAGCNFFAGYPITPSSSILHYLMQWLPATGGTWIQGEDEIASIGMCIAAAAAGRKVLTATSGPGISLYSENIGLAIIGEAPLVIVNVQRQGPATGSATKGAEGDVQFTRWGTSGGIPVVVLSPASVSEAYELTHVAFNLAEAYRMPVFLLTSKEIGVTRESVDLSRITPPPRIDRKQKSGSEPYLPYHFEDPAEVPLFSAVGGERITRFNTSTHDESGYTTTDPAAIQRMIDHYHAKVESAAEGLARYRLDRQEGAEILFVSYGVVSRSVRVAVAEARKQGIKVSSLVLQTLFPVPEAAIRSALKGIRRVVVPEMNMGQYRLEVERLTGDRVEVAGINQMDTTLLSPRTILEKGLSA